MRILSVSSILPIPGVISSNDFVFQTYISLQQQFGGDSIIMIRPVKLDLNPMAILKKTSRLSRLQKDYSRIINGFRVEIFPFYSAWGFRNVHALITRSIYCLNIKRIGKLFAENRFDIIHAQYIFPDAQLAFMLQRKYRIPYVVTTHNERFYFEHGLSRALAMKILRASSGVFPINQRNFAFYESINLPNTELIPLGFSSSFVRDQKPAATGIIRILTVAELIKLKNIDKVLLALKELTSRFKIAYTIIGKGPEKENLTKMTSDLMLEDSVTFIDHIPYEKIADEMHKHDIFIMPSFFETFGRVYFEAMAMGIPIVCAKNSGISGIFREGHEGMSVDHRNPEEIRQVLEFLLSDQEARLKIGMNGKRLVEQYTWEHISRALRSKYALAISGNTASQHGQIF